MPAHRLISDQQLEILISHMEVNRDLAIGRVDNAGTLDKQQAKCQWEALAAKLNAVGVGVTKTAAKWRDYWNERKYAVRKRARGCRLHTKGASSSLTTAGPWTAMDKRILHILGKSGVLKHPAVKPQCNEQTADPLAFRKSSTPSPQPHISLKSSPQMPVSSPDLHSQPAPMSQTSNRSPTPADWSKTEFPPPNWVLHIEGQRLASEERLSRATEVLAESVSSIAASLLRMEKMLERVYNRSLTNEQ